MLMLHWYAYCAPGAKPIVIGITAYGPPFAEAIGDGTQYYGFLVDIMHALCQQTQKKCVFKTTPPGTQYTALNQEKIDLNFAPNPIPDALSGDFMYTLPYISSNVQFVAEENSKLESEKQVQHLKIGVLKDTLWEALLQSKYIHDNTAVEYANIPKLVSAVLDKDVDVILINVSYAEYIVNSSAHRLKFIGKKILLGNGYGLIGLKKNAALIRQINQALLAIQNDGTYLKLYERYFGD
jgi:ABC-type amino acid transport substrate-binding protein